MPRKRARRPFRIALIDDSREFAEQLVANEPDHCDLAIKLIDLWPFWDEDREAELLEFGPGMIIVDLLLHGHVNDGLGIVRAISRSSLRNIPLIVVSRFLTDEQEPGCVGIRQAEEAGATACFAKVPFPSVTELLHHYKE